jgi:hypothetical protein
MPYWIRKAAKKARKAIRSGARKAIRPMRKPWKAVKPIAKPWKALQLPKPAVKWAIRKIRKARKIRKPRRRLMA